MFYLVGILQTSSPGDSISGDPERTFQQSRNRDTDVKKKLMDTKEGKGRWDELGGWD